MQDQMTWALIGLAFTALLFPSRKHIFSGAFIRRFALGFGVFMGSWIFLPGWLPMLRHDAVVFLSILVGIMASGVPGKEHY